MSKATLTGFAPAGSTMGAINPTTNSNVSAANAPLVGLSAEASFFARHPHTEQHYNHFRDMAFQNSAQGDGYRLRLAEITNALSENDRDEGIRRRDLERRGFPTEPKIDASGNIVGSQVMDWQQPFRRVRDALTLEQTNLEKSLKAIPKNRVADLRKFILGTTATLREIPIGDYMSKRSREDIDAELQKVLASAPTGSMLTDPEIEQALRSYWERRAEAAKILFADTILNGGDPEMPIFQLKTSIANEFSQSEDTLGLIAAHGDGAFIESTIRAAQEQAARSGKPRLSREDRANKLAAINSKALELRRLHEAAVRRDEAAGQRPYRLKGWLPAIGLWVEV